MITVRPTAATRLGHPIGLCSAALDGTTVFASECERTATLLSPELVKLKEFRIPNETRSLSLSPDGQLISIISDEGLTFVPTSEERNPWVVRESFECVQFSHGGEFFWRIVRESDEVCRLQLRNGKVFTRLHETLLHDHLFASTYSLIPRPNRDGVAIYTGDIDGQYLWYADKLENGLRLDQAIGFKRDEREEIGGVDFSRSGNELFLSSTFYVTRVRMSDYVTIGEVAIDWGIPFDEEEFWAEPGNWDPPKSVVPVSSDKAVVKTMEGRLLQLDTDAMEVGEELAIEGHEPQPFVTRVGYASDTVGLLPREDGSILSYHSNNNEVLLWTVELPNH